jgi:hypothetical protein|tara:strand:+ start:763 stop:1122 length:360 start_codon:yes stop_codon:yes gene_type:complete
MAYITTEQVKEIRNKIKEQFPTKEGWKFSIRRNHYSEISVDIMKAPINLLEGEDQERGYIQVNRFYPENYTHGDIFKKITSIAMEGNFDESDPMTDYFHVGWYYSLSVGKWDKPFEISK